MNGIKICEYSKNDRLKCIKLLEDTFQNYSGEENFAWRFETTGRPDPLVVCAKYNDQVVGFHSFIPWRFTYDNKIYLGYQGGDAATEKTYRGQGIQNKLINHAFELAEDKNIDFLFGAAGEPATMKAWNNSGSYQVAYYPLYQKIVCSFFTKTDTMEYEPKNFTGIMLHEEKKITPVVDDNYLEWRYRLNPKDYEIKVFKKDNNIAMFCVRKRKYRDRLLRISYSDLLLLDCQFSSFNYKFIKLAFNALANMYSGSVKTMSIFFNEFSDRGRVVSKLFNIKRFSHQQALMFIPINKNLNLNIFLNHNNWDILPHIVDWY